MLAASAAGIDTHLACTTACERVQRSIVTTDPTALSVVVPRQGHLFARSGLGHEVTLSDRIGNRAKQIYRLRRRRRVLVKHGSAWQIGKGPVSMLSIVTVLVGMTRGL